jgi:hypothetical protein
MLVNVKFYVRLIKGFQDESVRFLYFFVVLVIGAVNVSVMNQWTWDQQGVDNIVGVGSLFKGLFGILLPSNKLIQKVNLSPMVIYPSALIMLVVGCYLLFCGVVG